MEKEDLQLRAAAWRASQTLHWWKKSDEQEHLWSGSTQLKFQNSKIKAAQVRR